MATVEAVEHLDPIYMVDPHENMGWMDFWWVPGRGPKDIGWSGGWNGMIIMDSCLFNVRLGEGSGSLILLMVDRRRKSSLERTIDEHSKIDELFAENKEAKQRPRT